MSIIWLIIMLLSIAALLLCDPAAVLEAMITGANGAVSLALTLVALYGIWLGLFEVLESTGIADRLARLLRPLVRRLMPGESRETEKYISMNISANLLGLGNAATPMAINAVRTMKRDSSRTGVATTNMIMLTVISATSLQIFPSTVVSLRAAHGSADPAGFLPACIAATVTSTVIGILAVKLLAKLFAAVSARRAAKRAA